jgi:zinc transport system ATP-binding protein
VNDDLLPDLGLRLPPPLTLRLYAGTEVIFSSDKHWLHPLFDLEAFFAQSDQDPARTRLLDRITGRAAALLVARLGIPELHTLILSRRALPILERYGIRYQCGELVDRVVCATEDLLAEIQDLETAWSLLQERRSRSQAVMP